MSAEIQATVRRKPSAFSIFLLLLAGVVGVRLVSLWFNNSELFFDEAQYWFWSTDPAFGYFSKPPVLAWLIGATTWIGGSESAFFVRLASPLVHAGTAFLVFLAASRLFGTRTGLWAGWGYALLPGVSLSSTIISTDVPLLFFWAAALYAYVRLREEPDRWTWGLAMGVAIGAGLMSKYAMAYFLACAIIHFLIERTGDHPVRHAPFWGGIAVAVLMVLPNVFWNMENGFVTVSHTGDNIGWEGIDLNWSGVGEFFAAQFGVFGPILFGMFLATLIRMWGDSMSSAHRMLVAFSLPVLALILFQALMSKAYANWAATTYIAAGILVAEILVNRVPWFWRHVSAALHSAIFLLIAGAVTLAGPGQLVLPNGEEPFRRTQGAAEIGQYTQAYLEAGGYQVLLTANRKLSALLQYQLRDLDIDQRAWRAGKVPRDHYQLVQAYQDNPRGPVLLVTRNLAVSYVSDQFETVQYLGSIRLSAGEIERLHFHSLQGFKGPDT